MSVTNGIPDLRKIESAIQERGIYKNCEIFKNLYIFIEKNS